MSVEKILKNVKLPTLSTTLNKILELEKNNPVSIFNDIIKIIESDPLLSIHILKTANSPLFGFTQNVRSISHAVSLLGISQIRNIAFSFSIVDFVKNINYEDGYGKTFKAILKRSLMMGSIACIIGKNKREANSDELYLSGLISNFGQMILFLYSPREYSAIFHRKGDLLDHEKKLFKTDFIELGIHFCKKEGMPAFLQKAIRNQAKLIDKTENEKIIYLTSCITEFLLDESAISKKSLIKLNKELKEYLNLTLEDIIATLKDLPEMMESTIADFPEVQTELSQVVNASSEIIINLMKKELDLVIKSKKQATITRDITMEKQFLSHMLSLSREFSVFLEPQELAVVLTEYFSANLPEYKVKLLVKKKGQEKAIYKVYCCDPKQKGNTIEADLPEVLRNSINRDEPQFLAKSDLKVLNLEKERTHIAFPISYHKNNLGFLLLGVMDREMSQIDYLISYIRILSNIISNSFQNYFSYVDNKTEIKKKKQITHELIKHDEKLVSFESSETLLSRSRVLEEILPVIFHKLKNKLTPILGYSQLLSNLATEDKFIDKLQKIERNALELTNHLESLRTYFQTETIQKKVENINDIILKMAPYFSNIEEANGIELNLELDQNLPDLLVNRGQIVNLIMNLVENAVESFEQITDDLKIIDIRTEIKDHYVRLIIKDNGIGIEEGMLNKVWVSFYTTSKTRAGIGLTICEKVIKNHNANYDIQSQKDSHTEFIIDFPVETGSEATEIPEPVQTDKAVKDVLIIDDEEPLVLLMEEILQTLDNIRIFTVTNGQEALDRIDSNNFDLIVSDIHMPGINGIDIYNHMAKKGLADRVVMVTANPYVSEVSDFLKYNKIKYLKKPFGLMEFRRLVTEHLEIE